MQSNKIRKKVTITFEMADRSNDTLDLEIPPENIRLFDLIPQLHQLFDRIVQLELENKDISCQSGCSVCCNQLIPLSLAEVFYMYDMIATFPQKRQKRIKNSIYSIINRMEEAGLSSSLRNPQENQGIDQEYFKLGQKCPFLESSRCSIYQYRPFVCRDYNVTSSKHLCAHPYNNDIQKVRIKMNIGALLTSFSSRLYNLPSYPIPLLLIFRQNKKLKHIKDQKWPGIWLFSKIMDALTHFNPSNERFKIRL